MSKFWVVLIFLGVVAIAIGAILLYLIFGSGNSKGNTVNVGKGQKPAGGDEQMGDEQSETNIVQSTSQGGIHVLETTGMIHIDWKILLALSSIIIIAFMVKWAFQYKLFELINCNLCKKGTNENGENNKGDNQRLAEKGGVKRKRDEHCDYRPNLVETNKARRGHMLDKDNGRFEEMESVERGADDEINLFMNGIIQYTHEYRNQRH